MHPWLGVVSSSDQTGPTDDGCVDMHLRTQARKLRDPITSQSGSIAFPEKGLSLRGADRSEIRTRQSGLSIFAFLSMCTNTTPYITDGQGHCGHLWVSDGVTCES